MTKILFLSFCLLLNSAFGQVSRIFTDIQESVDTAAGIYISKLNCNSTIVTTAYFERLELDSNGERLVYLNNPKLNQILLSHLDDTSKVLAIHVILTKRLEPESSFRTEYVYDSGYKQIVRINYSCNNFTWHYLVKESNPIFFFTLTKVNLIKLSFIGLKN